MSRRNSVTIVVQLLLFIVLIPSVPTQRNKKTAVSLIYEAIAATNATLWLVEDARLFEKYSLDAKVVHALVRFPCRRW